MTDSDPDVRWMTYAEAAAALGVNPESVARRMRRDNWGRRRGNDGKPRVAVPVNLLPVLAGVPVAVPDTVPVIVPDKESSDSGLVDHLRAELERERTERAAVQAEAAALRAERDAAHAEAATREEEVERLLQERGAERERAQAAERRVEEERVRAQAEATKLREEAAGLAMRAAVAETEAKALRERAERAERPWWRRLIGE